VWIATDFGFFSIVEKPWDKAQGTLTVRARVRGDLVNFIQRAGASTSIADDAEADYHYRIQVRKADVATVLGEAVLGIDYSNFKNQVAIRQGSKRAAVYAAVWGVLLRLTDLNPVPLGKTPYQRYLDGVLPDPRE
jgi:predicted lipoprotein